MSTHSAQGARLMTQRMQRWTRHVCPSWTHKITERAHMQLKDAGIKWQMNKETGMNRLILTSGPAQVNRVGRLCEGTWLSWAEMVGKVAAWQVKELEMLPLIKRWKLYLWKPQTCCPWTIWKRNSFTSCLSHCFKKKKKWYVEVFKQVQSSCYKINKSWRCTVWLTIVTNVCVSLSIMSDSLWPHGL